MWTKSLCTFCARCYTPFQRWTNISGKVIDVKVLPVLSDGSRIQSLVWSEKSRFFRSWCLKGENRAYDNQWCIIIVVVVALSSLGCLKSSNMSTARYQKYSHNILTPWKLCVVRWVELAELCVVRWVKLADWIKDFCCCCLSVCICAIACVWSSKDQFRICSFLFRWFQGMHLGHQVCVTFTYWVISLALPFLCKKNFDYRFNPKYNLFGIITNLLNYLFLLALILASHKHL